MPKTSKTSTDTALVAPGRDLPPCSRDQMLDPNACELMPGHQHPADDVDELADSIEIAGQIHSGDVFDLGDCRLWVVAGRRRWLACQRRHRLYRADVYDCAGLAMDRIEDLARRLRVMENDQRKDPSAYDLAVQLRRIRNEHGYSTAQQLADHVAMTPARVKSYLGIFGGSDRLLEAAERHRLPISVLAELVRAERQLGEARTRVWIDRAVKGKVSAADLRKRRTVARHGAQGAKQRSVAAQWKSVKSRIRRLAAKDRDAAARHLRELSADLSVGEAATGTEGE